MARNVTETEVDALLAQPGTAGAPVVPRDFREPRRLSATDLDLLRVPAEAAAAAAAEALRGSVSVEVTGEVPEVAETSLDLFVSDPKGSEIVAVVADGAGGQSLIAVDARTAVDLAELSLGFDEPNGEPASRPLSSTERGIVERLLARALERAAQAMQTQVKEPRFASSRAEIRRNVASETDRRRVVVRIPLVVGTHRCVLHALLAGVKPPAPSKPAVAPSNKDAKRTQVPAEIAPTRVEVCAVLARTDVLLTEILALEPGDVIALEAAPGDPVRLEVEGQPRATVRFGAHAGRLAVRVVDILKTQNPR